METETRIMEVKVDKRYESDIDAVIAAAEPAGRRKASKLLSHDTSRAALSHGALLQFQNLEYTVTIKHDKEERARTGEKTAEKRILKGVSGICKPGEVFAILGSSGAGKTTLLDCLAGRKSFGTLKGDININGHPLDKSAFKYISAYVMQDDILLGSLSTRESLVFTAKLRDPTASMQVIDERVNALLRDMGLEGVADTYVGDEVRRGLSGGEKKRLAIALQLLADPRILFLDEPTTGLDAYNSVVVMQRVQDVAKRQGRTIICSVHQPRYSIFALFDRVMILSKGDVAYHGPADQALNVFASLGYSCPPHENPADYLIDVIVAAEGNPDKKVRDAIVSESDLYVKQKLSENESSFTDNVQSSAMIRHTKFYDQFRLLTGRAAKNTIRSPVATFVAVFQAMFMGLVLGAIYFGVSNEQRGIQDRLGVLFFVIINQVFSFMPSLAAFVDERVIFMRERASGLYETAPFYFSKVLVEVPPTLVISLIFCSIIYFMVGLQTHAANFFIFYATVIFMNMVALSLFMAVGAAAPNLKVAQMIGPTLVVVFALFGGFYINIGSLPDYFVWLEYPSFVRYAFEILAVNEFSGLTFTCKNVNSSCITTGEGMLDYLGMKGVSTGANFAILASMTVIYFAIGFVALKFSNFERR